ncbi:MAG: discoidin domain-containing protein [Tannerella sp.]|jgi:beta-galactosidase/beta-glucuronidase|nr:discoidin domain-containing protein [Tannerella sp.]
MKQFLPFLLPAAALWLAACSSGGGSPDGTYTRGIGVYPGDPAEYDGPVLVKDKAYGNLALHKAAYHSSSYDYNLTAQLVTDGLKASAMPAFINVSTQAGDLKKNEREWLFDGKPDSRYRVKGGEVTLRLDLNNFPLTATGMKLSGSVSYDDKKAGGYEISAYGSNDGTNWEELGGEKGAGFIGMAPPQRPYRAPKPAKPVDPKAPKPSFSFHFGKPQPTRLLAQSFDFKGAKQYAHYEIRMKMAAADEWAFGSWQFYNGNKELDMLPSQHFTSAWMSAGTGEEWVYVDFGAPASFNKVKLFWINKAVSGHIQSSDDARQWHDLASLPGGNGLTDEIALKHEGKGRYLRVLMTKSANNRPYVLSELEVYGKGGLVPQAKPQPAAEGNRLSLTRGDWKLQRASEVKASGEDISKPDFQPEGWIIATVPSTVLSSYWNIGALPNPNYSDNQLQISESYFYSDFWYRDAFELPASFKGGQVFLNFDGIDWKANVFVNGQKAGRIEGAFERGKFDITNVLKPGRNALAVEIIRNANQGAVKEQTAYSTDQNGGVPGRDNPTFHATIGWDWIPTIRGRDIGIWNDVYLTHTGAISIEDPFVCATLNLPDTTKASLFVEATLMNHTQSAISGTFKGSIGPVDFSQDVTLKPAEIRTLRLGPADHPKLLMEHPHLWWPKGYGNQYLYPVHVRFETGQGVSDSTSFLTGIRQMTFNEDSDRLSLFVNGRRFIGFGGNWGFPESNLNYRKREYDIAVHYHADMNFTMIRNWVGQTGDKEFYEACDRYGVMVWQDFWLANPSDGPDPDDDAMFMANVEDYVKRIRNHPSIALYVGRNEGNPPAAIDSAIRAELPDLHPGIHYISSSASGVVSGGGPYRALPPRDYFLLYGNDKFHSERGMPNVMNYESLEQTLKPDQLLPVNTPETPNHFYGMHDYTLAGAQTAASFDEMIEKAFGKPKDAKQFTEWAQWINYDGYRGIFEGRSQYRRGMLLWMSHPAWPSMVWQTYDYYFDPTAAYFGCKKACEPLHIQWNRVWDNIEVVNYHAHDQKGLTAQAQLINPDGTVVWSKEAKVDVREDQTVTAFKLEFPDKLADVYFIRLKLLKDGKAVSTNFYWRGKEDGNYKALLQVPKAKVDCATAIQKKDGTYLMTATLKNTSKAPAMMLHLEVKGEKDGQRILPVFFSDNYIFLMPGEERTINMQFQEADTRGQQPVLSLEGFNL